MQDSSSLYEKYLSKHLLHLTEKSTFARKKQWLYYNHKGSLPTHLDAHILEIGPGFGSFLDILVNDLHYNNVQAIDIVQEVVEACNMVVPHSTQHVDDTIDFLQQNEGKYDCIIALHVLEHIPKESIILFLKSIYYALKGGGRVIIEVPNMANPITGANVRYTDFTHTTGFTDFSLSYVLECAQFSNITVFACKVPPVSSARIAQHIAQKTVEELMRLALRIYMPNKPNIMSHILGATAVK